MEVPVPAEAAVLAEAAARVEAAALGPMGLGPVVVSPDTGSRSFQLQRTLKDWKR
jgi:hypothetical protein